MSQIGVAIISTEEALGAGSVETLIQLVAAANHGIKILRWGIFCDGTSVTASPGVVRLLRQTTAGTASALTLAKLNDSIGDSLDTTAQQDFTAEPTSGDVLDVVQVHPQSGYEVIYPLGWEPRVGAGDRIGLDANFPAAVNCVAKIWFEE